MFSEIREQNHGEEDSVQGFHQLSQRPLVHYSQHKHKKVRQSSPPKQPEPEAPQDVTSSDEIILLDVGIGEKEYVRPKRQQKKPPNVHVKLSKLLGSTKVTQLLQQYIPLYSSNLPKHVSKVERHLAQEIQRVRIVIEKRVYNSQTASPAQYLRFVYNHEVDIGALDRTNIEQVMANRLLEVERSIEVGKVKVQQKVQFKLIKKKDSLDISQLLKLKEGEIKDKLVELKKSISDSMFDDDTKKTTIQLDPNYFSPNSERTKQAQQFVKKMNEKQEQIRQHVEELKRKEKEAKEQLQRQKEFKEKEESSLKHIRVRQRHERRRELRKKQEELKVQQLKEFHDFVVEYKLRKPLYKKKEEAFSENFLIPEFEHYKMRLDVIKQQHQPITAEDLQEHERRYLQIKSEYEARREEEYKIRKSQDSRKRNSEYYRGKFHDIVMKNILAEKVVEDPKDEERIKRFKQQAYAKQIKLKYIPRVDMKKKKEMEELIEMSMPARKKLRPARKQPLLQGDVAKVGSQFQTQEPDPKVDGKRNMEALRKMIESYKREGKLKKRSDEKRAVSVSLEPRPDYLKELRQKRTVLINTSRHDTNTELEPIQPIQISDLDGFQRVRLRAALIDEHAERRERYIRHNRNQPVTALEEGSKLEDDYLASIRAKLSILQAHEHPASP